MCCSKLELLNRSWRILKDPAIALVTLDRKISLVVQGNWRMSHIFNFFDFSPSTRARDDFLLWAHLKFVGRPVNMSKHLQGQCESLPFVSFHRSYSILDIDPGSVSNAKFDELTSHSNVRKLNELLVICFLA